jgi:hypothetical protein
LLSHEGLGNFRALLAEALKEPDPRRTLKEIFIVTASLSRRTKSPLLARMIAKIINEEVKDYLPKLRELHGASLAVKRDIAQGRFSKLVPDAPKPTETQEGDPSLKLDLPRDLKG